jgi:hypothetical protein
VGKSLKSLMLSAGVFTMSKTTSSNNGNGTSKQQISKILQSQIMSSIKYFLRAGDGADFTADEADEKIKESAGYKILKSRYHSDGCIKSWSCNEFRFELRYSKSGAVKVMYMNNQGLQTAVYSQGEWECFTSFALDQIKWKLVDKSDKDAEYQRRLEREKNERKAQEFKRMVESIVATKFNEMNTDTPRKVDSEVSYETLHNLYPNIF